MCVCVCVHECAEEICLAYSPLHTVNICGVFSLNSFPPPPSSASGWTANYVKCGAHWKAHTYTSHTQTHTE